MAVKILTRRDYVQTMAADVRERTARHFNSGLRVGLTVPFLIAEPSSEAGRPGFQGHLRTWVNPNREQRGDSGWFAQS